MSEPITYTLQKGTDQIRVTVLDGGIIKLETDAISAPNHQQAESFELNIAKLGKTKRTARAGAHAHSHTHHGHTHSH